VGRHPRSFDARGSQRLTPAAATQLLEKRFARFREPAFQPRRAIAALARPRFRSILIPALPAIVCVLNACQLEVLFPVRPLFLQRRRAVTNLDPSGEAIGADPGITHVAQVFTPGYRTPSQRSIVDGAKQDILTPGPDSRSHQIPHSIFILFDILPPMRKASVVRLSAALLLAGGLWLAHTQQGGPPPSKLDLVKIKDDLYVIHNDLVPGNSTALITNDGVILVDDKFDSDYDGILAQLKKVTSKPIKYVINTHHHPDHSGSNAKMQKMDVQIVASQHARENMVDGNLPGLPNVVFDHHAQVYLGGKYAELYYFGRSHTNGDIVVLFPAQRTLAAGDMFTFGQDVPELIDYAGGGSGKEWTSTLDSALMLPFDTVVPGHGPITTKAEMAKFRTSTVTLRNRVHEMLVQKKSRDEVAGMLKKDFHFAQLHLDRSLDGLMVEMR
jgi:cyclase